MKKSIKGSRVTLKSNLTKKGILISCRNALRVWEVIWDGETKVSEVEKDDILLIKSLTTKESSDTFQTMQVKPLSTIGELRQAIEGLSDSMQLESYGPDSGGYDYERGKNVFLVVNDDIATIAHGNEEEVCIWEDKENANIIGRISGHVLVLNTIENIVGINKLTLDKAKEFKVKGVPIAISLYN